MNDAVVDIMTKSPKVFADSVVEMFETPAVERNSPITSNNNSRPCSPQPFAKTSSKRNITMRGDSVSPRRNAQRFIPESESPQQPQSQTQQQQPPPPPQQHCFQAVLSSPKVFMESTVRMFDGNQPHSPSSDHQPDDTPPIKTCSNPNHNYNEREFPTDRHTIRTNNCTNRRSPSRRNAVIYE
jgi:hypothetical protein